ncbi:MAG: Hsp20/alpha crystallin family protein [Planctomycetes bacterium]|nr:Hsp20/alpha crystallin family protein [Planctomycetota bacterium]
MDLIPWRKRGRELSLASFRDEMNKLFENFFSSGLNIEPVFGAGWSPALDISETDDAVTVKAELPGVDAKDVDLSLSGDVLTIKGEKKEEKEEKDRSYYRVERSYGSFSRTLRIPATVEPDKIEATFDKGVLSITMPKKEEQKGKKIEITGKEKAE